VQRTSNRSLARQHHLLRQRCWDAFLLHLRLVALDDGGDAKSGCRSNRMVGDHAVQP